jgi:hypothetical protein
VKDQWDSIIRENMPIPSAGDGQTMLDVIFGFYLRKRFDMKAQLDPLRELFEVGRVQLLVELGLTCENYVQYFFISNLQVRQQTNFFQHALIEVLRFVDDEHDLTLLLILIEQKGIKCVKQLYLLGLEGFNAEFGQQQL